MNKFTPSVLAVRNYHTEKLNSSADLRKIQPKHLGILKDSALVGGDLMHYKACLNISFLLIPVFLTLATFFVWQTCSLFIEITFEIAF